MINFNLRLCVPKRWKILVCRNVQLTKNWAFEFNVYRTGALVAAHFEWRPNGFHREMLFGLGALFHEFEFNIYDIRHEVPNDDFS